MPPRPIIPACGEQDLGNHITLTASYAASSFAAPPARPHNLYNLVKHRAMQRLAVRGVNLRSARAALAFADKVAGAVSCSPLQLVLPKKLYKLDQANSRQSEPVMQCAATAFDLYQDAACE